MAMPSGVEKMWTMLSLGGLGLPELMVILVLLCLVSIPVGLIVWMIRRKGRKAMRQK